MTLPPSCIQFEFISGPGWFCKVGPLSYQEHDEEAYWQLRHIDFAMLPPLPSVEITSNDAEGGREPRRWSCLFER